MFGKDPMVGPGGMQKVPLAIEPLRSDQSRCPVCVCVLEREFEGVCVCCVSTSQRIVVGQGRCVPNKMSPYSPGAHSHVKLPRVSVHVPAGGPCMTLSQSSVSS